MKNVHESQPIAQVGRLSNRNFAPSKPIPPNNPCLMSNRKCALSCTAFITKCNETSNETKMYVYVYIASRRMEVLLNNENSIVERTGDFLTEK